MDQKRILWIVAAVGIFLLVVVGAALILYAPSKTNNIQVAQKTRPLQNNGLVIENQNPQLSQNKDTNDLYDNSQNIGPTTVKELTVIAENATIISEKTEDGKENIKITQNTPFSTVEVVSNENQLSNNQDTIVLNNNEVTTQSLVQKPNYSVVAQNDNATTKRFPQVTDTQFASGQQVQIEVKPIKIETVAKIEASPTNIVTTKKTETAKVTASSTKTTSKPVVKQSTSKTNTTKNTVKENERTLPAKYWVQAASFTNKKNAEDARGLLTAEKIESEIFTYSSSDGKLYYRVRVGPYSTSSEAEYWKKRIALIEEFAKSYVTNSSQPLAKSK